jgi:hypothetical protein
MDNANTEARLDLRIAYLHHVVIPFNPVWSHIRCFWSQLYIQNITTIINICYYISFKSLLFLNIPATPNLKSAHRRNIL